MGAKFSRLWCRFAPCLCSGAPIARSASRGAVLGRMRPSLPMSRGAQQARSAPIGPASLGPAAFGRPARSDPRRAAALMWCGRAAVRARLFAPRSGPAALAFARGAPACARARHPASPSGACPRSPPAGPAARAAARVGRASMASFDRSGSPLPGVGQGQGRPLPCGLARPWRAVPGHAPGVPPGASCLAGGPGSPRPGRPAHVHNAAMASQSSNKRSCTTPAAPGRPSCTARANKRRSTWGPEKPHAAPTLRQRSGMAPASPVPGLRPGKGSPAPMPFACYSPQTLAAGSSGVLRHSLLTLPRIRSSA